MLKGFAFLFVLIPVPSKTLGSKKNAPLFQRKNRFQVDLKTVFVVFI